MPIPAEAVEAYEALRLYLLQSSSHQTSIPSAGILLRRGMLAWAGEQSSLVASTALPTLPLASLPPAQCVRYGVCALYGRLDSQPEKGAGLCLN